MPEVITLGETMVMFNPSQKGYLRYVNRFEKKIAGSESNVAIGLLRMGHSCGWVSRLGEDEFGDYVLQTIRGEGVDVSRVRRCPERNTGVMFKEFFEGRETRVYYYRKNSAAGMISPCDLDHDYISTARIMHLTGITAALGPSCLSTIHEAFSLAKEKNILISFDPNIRRKLWEEQEAEKVLKELMPSVDIFLPGLEEGKILAGKSTPEEQIDVFLDCGVKIVALKTGREGCVVADSDQLEKIQPFPVEEVVDPIGAGDAFAAGFLSGILEEKTLGDCGLMANAMGAFALASAGDFEALPVRNDLEAWMGKRNVVTR